MTTPTKRQRIDWREVLERSAAIVRSYETSVTLRQLFYRLVASEVLPNSSSAYKTLSARTAEARRVDGFPPLIDRTRQIHRPGYWEDPDELFEWAQQSYRRDRTEGQDVSVYVGVEKNGIVAQLEAWFGKLGIPVLALGGYSSQTYCARVVAEVAAEDRPAVLVYAGDFDPSGEDIDRDFRARTGCFEEVVRVALNAEQVEAYGLPPQPGKDSDSRAAGFRARHGELLQVELDALAPRDLRELYWAAIARYWDESKYLAVLERERRERQAIRALLDRWDGAHD